MTTTWYLIRHVPDLRRREPRNVGVVIQADDGWHFKFLGEDDDGRLKNKLVRSYDRDLSFDVYKTWVDYFKRKAARDRWKDVERLQSKRRSNYYAELGGQELADDLGAAGLVDRLFRNLVLPPEDLDDLPSAEAHSEPRIADRLTQAARNIFQATGVRPAEHTRVEGNFGDVSQQIPFRFRYDNGQPHLMDIAVTRSTPEMAAADARELSARIHAAQRAQVASSFLAFYSSTAFPNEAEDIIVPLRGIAHCIDIDGGREAEVDFARITHALGSGH